MRAVVGLWRWRHNPLRRDTDLAEAWVALVALLLMCVAAPVTGWICGTLTNASLQQSVRLQQEQRHPVTAQVLGHDEGARTAARDAEGATDHQMRRSVPARWTAPDGIRHTGTLTTAPLGAGPGDTVRIWTDDRGRPVERPMTEETAREQAVLAGIGTMLLAAGLVEGVRRVVVWQLVRRRYARLDRAWAQAGSDWGRTGAGS
ncbi:hypothetical protein AMK26_18085 [Streptomyces sp. CB03234]|uniref:Rv1733c family protein n=1 Tax=Streptomyces sp. (strain CB03234) TaxID=1703937 RepID=UPI00093EDB38|nr:hypothetical protein [Streptomyces sp. CB03234]OKK03424.1 hypothetical protein AMK26_18085 [Streptomyces sp. CB03234]